MSKATVKLAKEIATVIETARVEDGTLTYGEIVGVLGLIQFAYCNEAYLPKEKPNES